MINPSWRRFLSRKRFEVVFDSNNRGFVIRIESGRRKIINHDFVQGLGKPRRGLQIFDTRMDFSVPVQSLGRFL